MEYLRKCNPKQFFRLFKNNKKISCDTYMCKWCGTRYCKECLKGEFSGEMKEPNKCRVCNQVRCQGLRVEYVPRPKTEEDDKKRSKSAPPSRGPSTKSAKSSKSKSAKSGKKSGKKKKKK